MIWIILTELDSEALRHIMSDFESGIYMNIPPDGESTTYDQPVEIRNYRRDKFHLKVDYMKDIKRVKESLIAIRKYIVISMLIICLFTALIAVICVMLAYKSHYIMMEALEQENEEIYAQLSALYRSCKDNPLDFDWTTRILQDIEVTRNTVPAETVKLMIKLMESSNENFFPQLVSRDNENLWLHLDKGEGLKIMQRKAGSPETSIHRVPRSDPRSEDKDPKNPVLDPNYPEHPNKKLPCSRGEETTTNNDSDSTEKTKSGCPGSGSGETNPNSKDDRRRTTDRVRPRGPDKDKDHVWIGPPGAPGEMPDP